MVIQIALLVVFPALMAFAASSDLITMTISNRVSLALVAGFAVLAVATGMPVEKALTHVGAGALMLVIGFVLFARGWIGGGDAKLAAATALWLGFGFLYEYVLYASLFGGALTLALLEFRKYALPRKLCERAWIERLHRPNGGIPYGIALAAAALIVYPSTPWMLSLA